VIREAYRASRLLDAERIANRVIFVPWDRRPPAS
jgi:hypothetical protein